MSGDRAALQTKLHVVIVRSDNGWRRRGYQELPDRRGVVE
jgi:hypothetical protein